MFEFEIIFEPAGLSCCFYLWNLKKPFPFSFTFSFFMSENFGYEPACADKRSSPSKGTDTIEKNILPESRRLQPTKRPKNRQIMDIGVYWTAAECADMTRAWVEVSEDPTLGIDQTSVFHARPWEVRYSPFAFVPWQGAVAAQSRQDPKASHRYATAFRSQSVSQYASKCLTTTCRVVDNLVDEVAQQVDLSFDDGWHQLAR